MSDETWMGTPLVDIRFVGGAEDGQTIRMPLSLRVVGKPRAEADGTYSYDLYDVAIDQIDREPVTHTAIFRQTRTFTRILDEPVARPRYSPPVTPIDPSDTPS